MRELICIVCPNGCALRAEEENGTLRITGNACPRGEEYGRGELLHPVRILTGTVRVIGGVLPRCPVKSAGGIPKAKLLDAARGLGEITVTAPVFCGDVVGRDASGVEIVATRTILPAVPGRRAAPQIMFSSANPAASCSAPRRQSPSPRRA